MEECQPRIDAIGIPWWGTCSKHDRGGEPTDLHIANPKKYMGLKFYTQKYLASKFSTQKKIQDLNTSIMTDFKTYKNT